MLKTQVELELQSSIEGCNQFKREFEKAKIEGAFSKTKPAIAIISATIGDFVKAIDGYINDYSKGKATRSTLAAEVITRLKNTNTVALVALRVVMNSLYNFSSAQSLYREIGQAIEDEWKMERCKQENSDYYKQIVQDLKVRGANSNRIKTVINYSFSKQLEFHLEKWSLTEKIQTGMILINLLIESSDLIEFEDSYINGRHYKKVVPTKELLSVIEDLSTRLEVLHPQFLPMVCKPKAWSGVFDGGYISPYFKRNKLIKNNSKEYLKKLQTHSMPEVYSAINHLQNTAWQINRKVLDTVEKLWEEGKPIAELPDREDETIPAYPFPEKTKEDTLTEEEKEVKKAWKRESYAIHKRNVQKRSLRILVAQVLQIAQKFQSYEQIYFPYQMDFRGRLYPIPVLLQPQGSDLAKGLLRFAEGEKVYRDDNAIKWLTIHGANMFGYDKVSYEERIKWVKSNEKEILLFALNPLENRGWAEADKPFQFLAWCFEYAEYLNNPQEFKTHIPIQLDGSCNGIQNYSALLRDEIGGKAVNLIDSDEPADIYSEVAKKLIDKLKEIKKNDESNLGINVRNASGGSPCIASCSDWSIATHWLELGINRKLTKRPVMVLPYGGSAYSCREFIEDYLKENYSENYLWKFFNIGNSPADCIFKVSLFLSKYLWGAIEDTLGAAITGMDYLKKLANLVNLEGKPIEWNTPVGLPVKQAYQAQRKKMIRTELFGSILKTTVKVDTEGIDKKRQVNGICPNFIHSLDAACLMIYLNKCKAHGINNIMSVHDCYATLATDTETSARLLREAFVEIYSKDVLGSFISDIKNSLSENSKELPEPLKTGNLEIKNVLESRYFFN